MLVGPAGLVKKSTSSKKAFEILSACEDFRFMSTQFTSAALVNQLEAAGQGRFVEMDSEKFINSSVYIYASEAINTIKEKEGAIIHMLTDLYDCGSDGWSNDIAGWSKETISNGRINIFNPCLNFLGCSVPEWLVKGIGKDDLKSGFASRTLFIVHEAAPERSFDWDEDIEDLSHMRPKLIEDLQIISHLKGEYATTKGFRQRFNKFDKDMRKFLVNNPADCLYGYFARKTWHLLKLCQILTASKSNDMIIKEGTLDDAEATLEEGEKNMKN